MATRTIKTRLDLTGEQEYRDKLKRVNAELAEQKSKLKLLNEEYKNNRNSQEALEKKIKQLEEVQRSQNKVLEAAREGFNNARKEQDKYTAQIEEARKKIEAAQVELEKLNESEEDNTEIQEKLNAEIRKYQEQLDKAQENQEIAGKAVDDWAEKQSKAQTAVYRLNAQILQHEEYLKEAKDSADGCATSIDQYGKRVKAASDKQNELSSQLNRTNDAIGNLAAALAAAGLSRGLQEIAGALMECIDAAAEFETALAKVSTIADTSAMSMGEIKEGILKLSSETGQSVAELSEAAYNAISASVDTAGAVDFVALATKLATGGFTDNTTAVDILTTSINAYGLELEQAGQVADYLITTQNLGKTTVDELASSLGKVIPVASTYNVEMGNLSAAMAILTANGISTAESTTYLKSALNELGDSNKAVAQLLRTETGRSFGELMEQGYSLGDVMEILGEAVDNDKGAFNELWSSAEGGIAALSILSAGSAKYNDVLRQMETSAGATEAAYAKMADTSEMAEKKFTNAFENLKIAVGSELQDQMEGVYETGTNLLTWATEFIQKNEWLIPVMESVVTGLGALAGSITVCTVATQVIIPLFQTLAQNPISLVITAVVTLTGALAPLIAGMADTKSEVEQQTEVWKEHADALNESLDAYQEQAEETKEESDSTRDLADSLANLLEKEKKTVAEKEAIASITDQLNEKIPNLELQYDELADTVNMTAEELNELTDAMERQKEYENAKDNYLTTCEQKEQAVSDLIEAEEALKEATEKYNEELATALTLGQNWSWGVRSAQNEMQCCQEAVDALKESISESDVAIATMEEDIALYTIETAKMTEQERMHIDCMLAEAEVRYRGTEGYQEYIELIAQTAAQYDEYATSAQEDMDAVIGKLQAMNEAYQENYNIAYENITGQFELFEKIKVETSTGVDEMIESLGTQVTYMNEYAENMRLAMELGVDEGILQKLSDGSTESAAILAEIVTSGSDKITELNAEFAKVEEGKENFSSAIAELHTYYGKEMDELVAETEVAVKKMARYDDAYASAAETCNGIIAGVNDNWNSVISRYEALADAAMAAYNRTLKINSPSREFKWSAQMTLEGIELGIDENQQHTLDKYEKLAKESMDAYQKGLQEVDIRGAAIAEAERRAFSTQSWEIGAEQSRRNRQVTTSTTTQTFNIYTPVKSPSEIMRAARLEMQYGLAGD